MVKITIEVDDSLTQVHATPSSAPASYAVGGAIPRAPTEILAKAAASGAHSAGPAPTFDAVGPPGPVASSIAGPSGPLAGVAESAGAAPDDLPGARS